MSNGIEIEAILPFVNALEDLNISYYIGGSVASSAHGAARSTADIDFIVDIRPEHINQLVARLQDDFYIDDHMIRDAITAQGSFNIIHLATMFKIDVFILKKTAYHRAASERRVELQLFQELGRSLPLASPEDTILAKLDWYKAGDMISERQWLDILAVMKVQHDQLDWKYMRRWAAELGVDDLLRKAQAEADLDAE